MRRGVRKERGGKEMGKKRAKRKRTGCMCERREVVGIKGGRRESREEYRNERI